MLTEVYLGNLFRKVGKDSRVIIKKQVVCTSVGLRFEKGLSIEGHAIFLKIKAYAECLSH